MTVKRLLLAALAQIVIAVASIFASSNTALPTSDTALPISTQPAILTARDSSSWINVRPHPTVKSSASDHGSVGDRVTVMNQTQSDDGYTWYYVRLDKLETEGWIRGDFVKLLNESPRLPDRTNSIRLAAFQLGQHQTGQHREFLPGKYTAEQIDYFLEIAMGHEFGNATSSVRKWEQNIRIATSGTPTAEDLNTLKTVVAEINQIVQGIRLSIDSKDPNVEIYFIPESEFGQYEPNYQSGNYGFFWTSWNDSVINSAKILISTVQVTQKERSHLIREELTQSLGLMKDSYQYRDSIFFQGWTDPTEYSAMDKALIEMLYRPEIHPGMTQSQVMDTLNQVGAKPCPHLLNQLKLTQCWMSRLTHPAMQ